MYRSHFTAERVLLLFILIPLLELKIEMQDFNL